MSRGSRGSRIDRKWSGSGLDSPLSLPHTRTRSRTTNSPTSNSKKSPADEKKQRGTRAPDPTAALVLRHQIQNSLVRTCSNHREIHLRHPRKKSSMQVLSNKSAKMVIVRSAKKWQDVAESLIETSPLLGSPRGVAGGGATRSTNRLRIAGPRARERNPRDGMGMREERIEMNGLGMRVDRNERARFPEFEQLLLTSGPRD
jgi:hypothetical protein